MALVTAGLALLLAFLLHLGVSAVAVAILGGLPAGYLTWLVLPRSARKPPYGHPVQRWDPVELGVHPVIGGGPMPRYVRRPHDELIRAALDPAIRASRLVVVRGDSSTGKTRAAYEAVADLLPNWRLDRPLTAGGLAARLKAGVPARTVLWLDRLPIYVNDNHDYVHTEHDWAHPLSCLADLLEGEHRIVITTIWHEQWTAYNTAYERAKRPSYGSADPAVTAGSLLKGLSGPGKIDPARGAIIDVPCRFTAAEMAIAADTGDQVLADAAAAAKRAGRDGQIAQYLAGAPDLLERYEGRGGDSYGQAVTTAAMDATRLGHASPLPAALLQDAAVGYLTGPQRTNDIATWRDRALNWAAEKLKGAVQALQPVPPAAGTGVIGYQVADYLDQHGRRIRQEQLGPPSLWEALTAHAADAGDLTSLGKAAQDRGLYRHAAALWTKAATLGSATAACWLIDLLGRISLEDESRAVRWAASQASLDDPGVFCYLVLGLRGVVADDAVDALATRAASQARLGNPAAVAELLLTLRLSGAHDAVNMLLARHPADKVSPGNPAAVAKLLRQLRLADADDAVDALAARAASQAGLDSMQAVFALLRALREAGADDAVDTLAARAAHHTSLDNPRAAAELLQVLRKVGAGHAYDALAARAATQTSPGDPWAVAYLLQLLREAGAGDAVDTLATRAARRTSLDNPQAAANLLRALRDAGADDAVDTLAARAARHTSLDHPLDVAELLRALREAGADDAVNVLAARAAGQASTGKPWAVAELLRALREAGAGDAVDTLAARAARHTRLDDTQAVAALLRALREAGADDAVNALLARDPAGQASPGNPWAVANLLRALREAGADHAVNVLATRAASQVPIERFTARWADVDYIAWLLRALREAGAGEAFDALAARAARWASLDEPGVIAELLRALRKAGADHAFDALAARAARHASLDDPWTAARVLGELREAGADDMIPTLAARAANAGSFGLFLSACPDESHSYPFGREPDGAPSQPWRWQPPGHSRCG